MDEDKPVYVLDISKRAEMDIERILQDTQDKRGERQMRIYASKIDAAFELLLSYPMGGHVRYDIPEGYRAIAAGKHMIVYRVESNTIYVLAVIYSGMDFEKWLDS
jgi:toxin ParE1/3/4